MDKMKGEEKKFTEEEILKLLPAEGVHVIEQTHEEFPEKVHHSGFTAEPAEFTNLVIQRLDACASICIQSLNLQIL